VEHRTSGEKDTVLAAPNDLAVLYDDGPERAAPAFLDDSIASRVASSRNLLLSALVVALAGRAGSTAAVAAPAAATAARAKKRRRPVSSHESQIYRVMIMSFSKSG
jgi:hypothetical protein